jgi:putative ABC transport system permease protein
MLVKLLTGVFDPPPEFLSIPLAYLSVALALLLASIVVAVFAVHHRCGSNVSEYLRR